MRRGAWFRTRPRWTTWMWNGTWFRMWMIASGARSRSWCFAFIYWRAWSTTWIRIWTWTRWWICWWCTWTFRWYWSRTRSWTRVTAWITSTIFSNTNISDFTLQRNLIKYKLFILNNKKNLMRTKTGVIQLFYGVFHIFISKKFYNTSSIFEDIGITNITSFSHMVFKILPRASWWKAW